MLTLAPPMARRTAVPQQGTWARRAVPRDAKKVTHIFMRQVLHINCDSELSSWDCLGLSFLGGERFDGAEEPIGEWAGFGGARVDDDDDDTGVFGVGEDDTGDLDADALDGDEPFGLVCGVGGVDAGALEGFELEVGAGALGEAGEPLGEALFEFVGGAVVEGEGVERAGDGDGGESIGLEDEGGGSFNGDIVAGQEGASEVAGQSDCPDRLFGEVAEFGVDVLDASEGSFEERLFAAFGGGGERVSPSVGSDELPCGSGGFGVADFEDEADGLFGPEDPGFGDGGFVEDASDAVSVLVTVRVEGFGIERGGDGAVFGVVGGSGDGEGERFLGECEDSGFALGFGSRRGGELDSESGLGESMGRPGLVLGVEEGSGEEGGDHGGVRSVTLGAGWLCRGWGLRLI